MSSAETHHQNNRLEQLLKVVVLPVAARVTAAPAPNAATLAGAGLICAVAVAAMIGWYVKSVSLVQILPGLVPMQFNSALGFLFCGIALASGVIQARRVALVAAALAFTIGTLTLFEYVPGVSIGIDEIFVTHFTNEQTLYQGRMAVATAISFTFAGASILLLNYPRSINWRPVVVACTGSIIIGMGVVSHIGYISSTDYSYGFGIFSRMAIHTAAGFEIIGASLVTIAWRETRKKTNRIPEWLAIPVGISVAAIAFVLWQTLAIDEDIKIERSINIRSESAALKIENQFTQPAQALIRMGVIWEIEGGTSRELWEAQALSYLSSISSMKAIALIDPSLRVQWVMPPGAVNRLQGLDLSLNPKQKTVIEEAIESRATTDANSIEGAQVSGVVNVYVPIFIDNQFDGLILAELDVGALLQSVSEEFDAVGYVLALYEDDTEVYVSPNAEERAEQWEHTSNFEIQGKTWHMAIWPTEDRLGELKTNIPLFTLFTGLLMAAITAVGINQAQTAGSRARLIAETNLELSAEVRRRTAVEQNLRDLNTNLVSRTSDLQEATTNLEIEVEERKRIEESLVSNTHELERSNSELERFAYVASHDLQTPIRTIIGFSQILAEDYRGKLDPAADDIISRIVDSGSYMQNLINDLLEYSRIGSNYTAGETVDCEALVKKQINVFEQEIRDSHTVITCENLPVIQGERTMLDQVFRNLIGNALKYRNKQPNLIHISGQVTENEWVISVKDNGIGMEPQYLQRIFGIFQRLHLREEYEGTGIGLAICKKAVERLGGRIWVESVRGEGSTFFFTIPMPVENNSQNWPDNGERPNNSTADL